MFLEILPHLLELQGTARIAPGGGCRKWRRARSRMASMLLPNCATPQSCSTSLVTTLIKKEVTYHTEWKRIKETLGFHSPREVQRPHSHKALHTCSRPLPSTFCSSHTGLLAHSSNRPRPVLPQGLCTGCASARNPLPHSLWDGRTSLSSTSPCEHHFFQEALPD